MKFVVMVDLQQSAKVEVEAETEEQALKSAAKIAVEEPEKADWEKPVADSCTVIGEFEDYSALCDRAFEEKKEACFA